MTNTFAMARIKGYPTDTIKIPTRGTEGSAGWDFYCPGISSWFRARLLELNKDTGSYSVGKDGINLPPKSRILIPSGLKVRLPPDTALIAFEKSGLATKSGVVPTCRVVDMDYQGELCVGLLNTGSSAFKIAYGTKIGQYLLVPVIMEKYTLLPEDRIYTSESERGSGGFGSTGA